jgi:hypothetical protein
MTPDPDHRGAYYDEHRQGLIEEAQAALERDRERVGRQSRTGGWPAFGIVVVTLLLMAAGLTCGCARVEHPAPVLLNVEECPCHEPVNLPPDGRESYAA